MGLLDALNEEQGLVAKDTEGKVLCLAGAGSGKTRTLTYRVAHILEHGLANCEEIMCVTFTNKAAREMKERVVELLPNIKGRWWIGTFHGLCVRLLMAFGHEIDIPNTFTIADESEQNKIIKEILADYENFPLDTEQVKTLISNAKSELIGPDKMYEMDKRNKVLSDIYREYEIKLKNMNALDFDDIILNGIRLFDIQKIKEHIQSRFKYVMVDESQDLNKANYEFVKLVSNKHGNLMLIGDDSQSIYSWRGSNINIILDFEKLEGTKTYFLKTNYRSTSTIVDASNNVISNNRHKIEKICITDNDKGDEILYYRAENEWEEAQFISSIIEYYCNSMGRYRYGDFAVLYRTHSLSRLIEQTLMSNFIPYTMLNSLSFLNREEIKDALAYLRMIVNPMDYMSFQRVINKPKRGVGDTTVKKILMYAAEHKLDVFALIDEHLDNIPKITAKAKEALVSFSSIMQTYKSLVAEELPHKFLKNLTYDIGYLDYINDSEDKINNLYSLVDLVENWNYINSEDYQIANIIDLVHQLSLFADLDEIEGNENTVKMMTVHSAKGLEFPVVFIVGVEESIFPLRSYDGNNNYEEERRLFYVAMTRAKERLFISNSQQRRAYGDTINRNAPSRFLNEVPQHLMKNAY